MVALGRRLVKALLIQRDNYSVVVNRCPDEIMQTKLFNEQVEKTAPKKQRVTYKMKNKIRTKYSQAKSLTTNAGKNAANLWESFCHYRMLFLSNDIFQTLFQVHQMCIQKWRILQNFPCTCCKDAIQRKNIMKIVWVATESIRWPCEFNAKLRQRPFWWSHFRSLLFASWRDKR